MKILYNIKLHEKALQYLELIEKATIYENTAKAYLDKWDKAKWMDMIRIAHDRESLELTVIKYSLIRQRLTKAYCNVMAKLNDIAADYLESKKLVSEIY